LLSNLNSAVEAMKVRLFSPGPIIMNAYDSQAHSDFSTEDANVILGEFQKIEPVISSVMDSIGTRTKILIGKFSTIVVHYTLTSSTRAPHG
jgi:hypothetical protein